MSFLRTFGAVALTGAVAAASLHPALAQGLFRPPGAIPGGEPQYSPAQAQDAASLLIRIDRLENQIRAQNGQIEQMQFQMRQLQDQLRKFQQDVDFRFQENSGKPAPRQPAAPQRRTDLDPPATGATPQAPTQLAGPVPTGQATGRPGRRNDAFNPEADPMAPGAPRPLGSPASSATALPPPSLPTGPISAGGRNQIIEEDADDFGRDGPLDLNPMNRQPSRVAEAPVDAAPASLPRVLPPLPQNPSPAVGQTLGAPQQQMASLPPQGGSRADFDAAMTALRGGQFEDAQNGLQDFLKKYPKDKLAFEAVFQLGESFAKRSRHREAAEQYLKVSTDFPKTTRAPESLVKLGMSLEKLGMKEQACASFNEVPRKYPNAPSSLRTTADREAKRNQC